MSTYKIQASQLLFECLSDRMVGRFIILEAITASISMARQVESVVGSDAQISGHARQRLSNTVAEEASVPHM